MPSIQEAVAAAARALVGVRFRPQGRDPAYGLDCVGLVAAALAGAGRPVVVPSAYAQRGGEVSQIAAAIDAVPGLLRIVPVTTGPGDILLMMPGAAQHHLGIVTDVGFVHADAGLRRIVERPGAPPWPIHGAWRVAEAG